MKKWIFWRKMKKLKSNMCSRKIHSFIDSMDKHLLYKFVRTLLSPYLKSSNLRSLDFIPLNAPIESNPT